MIDVIWTKVADVSEITPDQSFYDDFQDNGHPRLVESFVGHLDVLGTQSGTLDNPEHLLAVTNSALYRAHHEYDSPHTEVLVRWFSDNAVLATKCVGGGFDEATTRQLQGAAAIVIAGLIQLELSNLGLFLRGGMDVGPFFASEQFVFGPALVGAYTLESKEAVVPRIVLSQRFAEYAREQVAESSAGYPWEVYTDLLSVDDDGLVFVNYLGLAIDKGSEVEAWLANHLNLAQSKRRHARDPHVREKYEWSARYHDRFCREFLEDHGRLDQFLDDPSASSVLKRL